MTVVAVYGTLRYGGSANSLLRGCKRIGEDRVRGSLYHLGGFPGFKRDGDGDVTVDLYSLPEDGGETLSRLDRYEGYKEGYPDQSLYERQMCATKGGYAAFIYVYSWEVTGELLIPSGDWFESSYPIE